jgi:hypothetical protein
MMAQAPRSREAQPASRRDVEASAAEVEAQQEHSRPSGDDAGINPARQQGTDPGPRSGEEATSEEAVGEGDGT